MKEIILKSRILKEITGINKIENHIELDNIFPDLETIVDAEKFNLTEQDLTDMIDDWKKINSVDTKLLTIKNMPDIFKKQFLIYSRINYVPEIGFSGMGEFQKGLINTEIISDELKDRILKYKVSNELTAKDIFSNLHKGIPCKDAELFIDYGYIPKIIINNNGDLQYLSKNYKLFQNHTVDLKLIDMSVLSLEQINQLSNNIDIGNIYISSQMEIEDDYNNVVDRYNYTLQDYIKLRCKIDEILLEIDKASSDVEKFFKIYKKLGETIVFDFDEDGEPNDRDEAHNLIGALLEGKCVCEGYALALKQVSKCAGIDCKYIMDEDHAWNQVKLNEQWYNCDLTCDAFEIEVDRTKTEFPIASSPKENIKKCGVTARDVKSTQIELKKDIIEMKNPEQLQEQKHEEV